MTTNVKTDAQDHQAETVLIALITQLGICSVTVYAITDTVDSVVRRYIAIMVAASQPVPLAMAHMPAIVSSVLTTLTRTCMELASAQNTGQVYPVLSV